MRATRLLAAAFFCAAAAIAQTHAQAGVQQTDAVLRTLNGELTGTLDSKTAKTGDAVVIRTTSTVRLADDTEIPKGSKVVARVTGVKPAGAANAQIALAFDRIELKKGRSLPIQGEIESIAAAEVASSNASDLVGAAPSNGSAGRASGDMYGSTPSIAAPSQIANQVPENDRSPIVGSATGASTGTHPNGDPVVARSADLIIRATTIPGLLVANREPGSAAAQSSSILLGARRDILLEGGTRFTIEVASQKPVASARGN